MEGPGSIKRETLSQLDSLRNAVWGNSQMLMQHLAVNLTQLDTLFAFNKVIVTIELLKLMLLIPATQTKDQ